MFYIYTLLNNLNYKVYVGQTQDLKHRWSSHKSEAKANRLQYPLYKALRKYGYENFQLSVIDVLETSEETDLAEQYWIQYFESRGDEGYNIAPGGTTPRGWHHTEEHKQYMSNLFKGKRLSPPFSDETRHKISITLTGHTVSEETRIKISESNMGKIVSLETRDKMSGAKHGIKLTDEHKKKISEGLLEYQEKNTTTSNLAKLTFDVVERIRKEWFDGNISQRELAQKYGVHRMTVMRIVNNQTRKRS